MPQQLDPRTHSAGVRLVSPLLPRLMCQRPVETATGCRAAAALLPQPDHCERRQNSPSTPSSQPFNRLARCVGLLPWMVDLAFRSSQAANVTTVVRGGLSADDSIATLELAIDKVCCLFKRILPKGCMWMRAAAVANTAAAQGCMHASLRLCSALHRAATDGHRHECIGVVPSVPL